jgi:hypothetical protein
MLRADSGSRIYLSNAGSVFAFDGGTANMHIPFVGQATPFVAAATEKRQYAVFGSNQLSTIVTDGSDAVASSTTNTPTATRTVSDTRATTPTDLRKIMTRSAPTTSNQYLYGAPGTRTWDGTGTPGTEHNYIANPTNIGALGAVPAANATIGITYSAVLTKGGTITN